MPVYRALRNLSGVCQRGELTRLAHLNAEQIAKLMNVGAVAPIAAPPLAELPEWAIRAGKLAKLGITDVEQLLEVDAAQVAKTLRVKVETARQYQRDAEQWLVIREETVEQE